MTRYRRYLVRVPKEGDRRLLFRSAMEALTYAKEEAQRLQTTIEIMDPFGRITTVVATKETNDEQADV